MQMTQGDKLELGLVNMAFFTVIDPIYILLKVINSSLNIGTKNEVNPPQVSVGGAFWHKCLI